MASAIINRSTAADHTLVVCPAGGRIKVLSFVFQAAAPVNVTFKSGATPITGPLPQAANTGVSCTYDPNGWFTTERNQNLVMHLSAAVQVSGVLNYTIVD